MSSKKMNLEHSKHLTTEPTHLKAQSKLGLYIAHISEEVSGRSIQAHPIKLLGENPYQVGQKVAELIKHRYLEADRESLETMQRSNLACIQLKSSYLMIYFECPPAHIPAFNRSKAFPQFAAGLKAELHAIKIENPVIRRRRKPGLSVR